jgi:hypothetical protein
MTRTKMIRIKDPKDIPDKPHFALILYSSTSVHIEGDERSRTNPGHGYPAHTDTYDTFQHWVTLDREVLIAFVNEIEESQTNAWSKKDPYVILNVEKKGVVARSTTVMI